MESANEDDQTRQLALDFGWIPVVMLRRIRLEPWEYDRLLYRRYNEVERLFRWLKGFSVQREAEPNRWCLGKWVLPGEAEDY